MQKEKHEGKLKVTTVRVARRKGASKEKNGGGGFNLPSPAISNALKWPSDKIWSFLLSNNLGEAENAGMRLGMMKGRKKMSIPDLQDTGTHRSLDDSLEQEKKGPSSPHN